MHLYYFIDIFIVVLNNSIPPTSSKSPVLVMALSMSRAPNPLHTTRTTKQIIEVFLPNQACPGHS
jgi:hypothetical protein